MDIAKSGAYKYAEAPDFAILLLAFKVDSLPTVVIDLANGETVPQFLSDALNNPTVTKHAWNAAFEWYCLNKAGYDTPIDQWHCTMVRAMYHGYPASLDKAGEAVGLAEDKKKLMAGKALIKYFCTPCKPTKSNGGRTWNLPHHDTDKWELFKEYNRQDVEAEYAIDEKLLLDLPQEEWHRWHMDTLMMSRGVGMDAGFIDGALSISDKSSEELINRAKDITGLDNPKSNTQLLSWVREQGVKTDSLNKATVAELLDSDIPSNVREMLLLKQQIGKSSNAKYVAMANCLCTDHTAKGLIQYYGASRTGRYCLTGDHEVLTPTGWVRLDEWDGGKIATWSPNGEIISFQKANALEFDYEGPMLHLKDQRIDQISTPDHKMYFRTGVSEWRTDTVENMCKSRPMIPFFGYRANHTPSGDNNALRVLIMVQADGFFTAENAVKFNFSRKRKIDRCKMLLRKCDIPFIVRKRIAANGSEVTHIEINQRDVPLWLRQFRDKVFGWWMLNENADVILEEIEYWDGTRSAKNSVQYTSTVKQNADIIQAIAHLNGKSGLVTTKHRDKDEWNTAYIVNIWFNPTNAHEIKNKPVEVDFKGKVYCAETKTGFFLVRRGKCAWITGNSGKQIQVQNLPRNYLSTLDDARELVKRRDYQGLKVLYGNVPDTLSQLIRTAFVPTKDKFIVCDFSSIEARISAWVAGEEWVLDVFRNGRDIYCETASQMFGVPVEKHGVNSRLRAKGKIAVLALGYQGGTGALKAMGALSMGIHEEELQTIVDSWRLTNNRIVQTWYGLQNAAEQVITTGEPTVVQYPGGFIRLQMKQGRAHRYMTITLPSGRELVYCNPSVGYEDWKTHIYYEGVNQTTRKWEIQETYGGKLFENVVQAIARDCLVETMARCEEAGYDIRMHVHDEIIIDAHNEQSVKDVETIFAEPIPWAPGLPLAGDGFEAEYYRKD